jgi:predicted RND superfamily exporter protein
MLNLLVKIYSRVVLGNPLSTLLVIFCVIGVFAYHAKDFRLDASSDSLVLENDEALKYYRSIRENYGSDEFLVITYTPHQDLFSNEVLDDLKSLRDKLSALPRVKSVITVLDVPLIESPPITLSDLQRETITLGDEKTDRTLARRELVNSPLYKNLLISEDAQTTALQVNLKQNETWRRLLDERNRLREKRLNTNLSPDELAELSRVSREYKDLSETLQAQLDREIAEVRDIMMEYKDHAQLYLGGIPMITADSIEFVRNDLMNFGIGVLCFLIMLLAIAFRKPRWVLLPLLTCGASGLVMVGYLGWVDWPVTVVSSNFVSLLLIITLSLTIHIIVRYRELHKQNPHADQYYLVLETVKTKAWPCLYTAVTTIVAFGSLLVSDIRPVIDFGRMMSIGISAAFILAFTLFPAALMLLKPGEPAERRDLTGAITRFFAQQIERRGNTILAVFLTLNLMGIVGIGFLSVENRFIDYYKESTEIYQGMELIDKKLGGTTPLDVIIDAPADFFQQQEETESDPFLDELELDLDLDFDESSAGITGTSYWFNSYRLDRVEAIHNYLDELPESGKVMSITSTMQMLEKLNQGKPIDDFFLALLYKKLPTDIKQALISPYLSEDGNQLRFSIRVFESDATLKREALLQKIRRDLTTEYGLEEDQLHLSGMVVLYNNLLQSLFRSQILTVGVVFLAILLVFFILFRHLPIASIAIIPNITAAVLVLGLMGWLGIPLDIMTITIAAIVIGIGVDNTIHYIHRVTDEFQKDQDYWASIKRSHGSIGRALYYTTITVTLGFSILALSNFIPTIYFGLLTGFSMIAALMANLLLLPLLIARFKPLRVA